VIVDTSAVVAILREEPGYEALATAIETADPCQISAATFLELLIVIGSLHDTELARKTESFLQIAGIVIVDVTEAQARIGQAAYRRFGRGSGHPAKLNFGDCFSYALAIDLDEPLLFKGNDFIHTDVRVALPPTN